jgi:hypothetical protein
MFRTPLAVLAQPAPLADKLPVQEPVTLLHKCTYHAIALGHDVVRRVQRIAPADSNLASLHQAFGIFGFHYRHEF